MKDTMRTIWETLACWENVKVWAASWLGFFGSVQAAREWMGLVSLALGIAYTARKLWQSFQRPTPGFAPRTSSRDEGTGGTFGVVLVVGLLLTSGCSVITKTPRPQKGGHLLVTLPVIPPVTARPVTIPGITNQVIPQIVIEAAQPENPNTPTEHSYSRTTQQPDGTSTTEEFRSSLGTTQHDKARDDWGGIAMAATKLKAARLPQILGFMLVLASLAMFHPAVRSITMSSTLQWVTGGVGLGLIFLSPMFATMDATLVVVGIGVPAAYYFIWKHGRLQGELDANKNGIPDRLEGAK